MSEQNIIPTAPTRYQTLPDASKRLAEDLGIESRYGRDNAENFRLKNICDEISNYKKFCKRYKKVKVITQTADTVTRLLAVILSPAELALSSSGIGIVGAPLVAVATLSALYQRGLPSVA